MARCTGSVVWAVYRSIDRKVAIYYLDRPYLSAGAWCGEFLGTLDEVTARTFRALAFDTPLALDIRIADTTLCPAVLQEPGKQQPAWIQGVEAYCQKLTEELLKASDLIDRRPILERLQIASSILLGYRNA